MLTHDRFLDLAASAIDFDLLPDERDALGAHLASCSGCRTEARAMRRDAERLVAMPSVPPPAWVALAIGRRRRSTALVLAMAALVLSGVLAAAVVAGSILREIQQPSPVPSVVPTATAFARPDPQPYPSRWLNLVLRVTAADLVLRQIPSLDGAEIATARRDFLVVTDDALRIQADGFDWYHATILSELPLPEPLPGVLRDARGASGWVAVGSATGTSAIPMNPRCPFGTAIEDVAAMLEAERLACFGAMAIEVEGLFTCSSCSTLVEGVYSPAWLAGRSAAQLLPGPIAATGLELHLPPDGPAWPAEGSRIRVRGHFDDAAAGSCALSETTPDFGDPENTFSPVDLDSVRLLCRQAFVVESYDLVSPAGSAGS